MTPVDPRVAALNASTEMEPVAGEVTLKIPPAVFWGLFEHPNLWPRWNPCFYWARNTDLVQGDRLVWIFQPIRPWYLYKMPAIADIAEVAEQDHATWHVTALPGFFARHTYHMTAVDAATTRFGSWEKATGPTFRATSWFWVAHFRFVLERSLAGARRLEALYVEHGRLDADVLPPRPIW